MTNRRAVAGFLIGALWIGVILGAIVLTWKDRTKPSVFVPPVIWSVPYTGGAPRLEFEI